MKQQIFNAERSNYYKAKRRELSRLRQSRQVVVEDALFIKHYGMSAFLELFPEAKGFGVSWHREVIQELEIMKKRELSQLLSGIYMASVATKDKKANRKFRKIVSNLLKRGNT